MYTFALGPKDEDTEKNCIANAGWFIATAMSKKYIGTLQNALLLYVYLSEVKIYIKNLVL